MHELPVKLPPGHSTIQNVCFQFQIFLLFQTVAYNNFKKFKGKKQQSFLAIWKRSIKEKEVKIEIGHKKYDEPYIKTLMIKPLSLIHI